MKRVRSACLFQTLVFSQKPDSELSKAQQLEQNREEYAKYKAGLDRSGTKYIIDDLSEQDSSVIVKIRKQYSETTDVGEYFN